MKARRHTRAPETHRSDRRPSRRPPAKLGPAEVVGGTRIDSPTLVIGPNDSQPPFEQAYYRGGPLTIGFESARVTYTGSRHQSRGKQRLVFVAGDAERRRRDLA